MGEEAKNPKKDIARAVLLSLAIQGAVCYLFEYFAANYFLNSGYTISNAGASGAPLGDMMVLVGTWLFGSYAAGKAFMLVQAGTVFLALIGTTLSCMNTGARVTYAMGRDEEVPVALRPVARPDPLAAPRDLDPGRDLDRHRHHHDHRSISAVKARTSRRWTSTTSGTASASSRRTLTPSCPTRCSSSR